MTESFRRYEFSKTKMETEKFFWQSFCDNYLELVKDRIYNPEKYSEDEIESAKFTLYTALETVLKLMAPVMPYITEEIFHLYFAKQEKSIHNTSWPMFESSLVDEDAEKLGDLVVAAVTAARRAKTERQVSLKSPIKRLSLKGKITRRDFETVEKDIKAATSAETVVFEELDEKAKIDFEHVIEL